MRVASGPCVPLPGRTHPVCSVHQQEGYETPAMTASLFEVLTAATSDELLDLVAADGDGHLFRFTEPFVAAMAAANRELVRLGGDRGPEGLEAFTARRDAWADAWLAQGGWPRQVVGTQNRLHRLGLARVAEEKGQPLYVWYGPAVPEYVVRHGAGRRT